MKMLHFIARLGLAALVLIASAARAQQLTETFDSVPGLIGAGWVITNNSNPAGTTTWFQGNAGVFAAQAGAANAYGAANFNNAGIVVGVPATISDWLISPQLTNLQFGQTLTFYTRSAGGAPDRLQVRLCVDPVPANCLSVGTTETDTGNFTTLLLDINPSLIAAGYPIGTWMLQTVNLPFVSGTQGRIAFRYFVTNAGPTGVNSDYIGIDTLNLTPVELTSFTAE
jgi:hypothetical protein